MNLKVAAQILFDADCKHNIVTPITEQLSDLKLDEAYEIQRALIELKQDAGEEIIGWKIGLTNVPAQKSKGITEPVFGRLTSSMVLPEGPCPIENFASQPKIEGELAFCMKGELSGPGVTLADVYNAVDYVVPAIEIPAGRTNSGNIIDMISDNVLASAIVLGSGMKKIRDVDMRLTGMNIERNGEVIGTATTAAVLGSPVQALIWLANALSSHGESLKPGDIVMTGALLNPIPADKGDVFTISFQGMGSVNVKFA